MLIKNEKFLIPKIHNFKGLKRTYLPYKAICKENDFVIGYWSGGNCDHCELSLEFSVNQYGLSTPRFISHKTVLKKYQSQPQKKAVQLSW
ncbi:MAG: hypothetical protein CSA18_00985 [Deltaproteobacteria bacterium]|nr:MAG: hypothetical protein CSA18_00985 [Deltaproteobacteria bacterium]